MDSLSLSDIAEIVMGQSPKGEHCNSDPSGTPLLNGPTEFGPRFPVAVQFTTDPKRFSKVGDILFCVRGSTTGRMNFADHPYAIGRGIAAIRGKNGYPTAFVKGIIDSTLSSLLVQATGSTFPNVSREMLKNLKIPFVDSETAKAIAKILSSLDDKIELNRRMNATLEAMARALFRAWFVDFEPVHANKENRPSTSASPEIAKLFPSEFENGIPKGWTVATVDGISSLVTRGVTPKYEESTGRFIINQRVNRGLDLNFSELKELASDLEVPREKYAQKYDVLVNCLGEGTLGRTHLYLGDNDKYAVDQHMSICRPMDWRASFYLYYIFSSEEGQNRIESLKTGTTGMTMFNISKLRKFDFTLPEDRVLAAYGDSVCNSWDMIERKRKESQVLAELRDSLLPRLISGKIPVPTISEGIE